jgi:hypothetical protein
MSNPHYPFHLSNNTQKLTCTFFQHILSNIVYSLPLFLLQSFTKARIVVTKFCYFLWWEMGLVPIFGLTIPAQCRVEQSIITQCWLIINIQPGISVAGRLGRRSVLCSLSQGFEFGLQLRAHKNYFRSLKEICDHTDKETKTSTEWNW